MEEIARARVSVQGMVQGVFFRAETKHTAESLGLAGWVRNVEDGTVEAVFEGSKSSVLSAIEWCRRGPPHARVSDMDFTWEEPVGEVGFQIKYRGW
jgi:acylphosphatase